jgi:heterodisulfide reductase subunit C
MSMLVIPGFVQEIRRYGKFDVNACMNCGSCTVTCNLAGTIASFPRRPIQLVLNGAKESLLRSVEPWICHDCGDCSTTCPRQAEPSESMATLRRYLAGQYDITGLSSRSYTSRVWEFGSIFFLFILVIALVGFYHLSTVKLAVSDFLSTAMGMEHMFGMIQDFTLVVFALPLLLLTINSIRMVRYIIAGGGFSEIPFRYFMSEATTFFEGMFTHKQMSSCEDKTEKLRRVKHWFLGFGFSLMCVIVLFFLRWFQTDNIYPIYHPQRWLGYLATIPLLLVSLDIIIGRLRKRHQIHKFSELSDMSFPVLIFLVALTGIAVHIFRYLEWTLVCHFTYALHIAVTVPLLVFIMPFAKWSHAIYRPLALYLLAVKEKALAAPQHDKTKGLPADKPLEGAQTA